MGNIGFRPGDEVVDTKNVPALFDKEITKMRSEESCSTCDDDTQISDLSPENLKSKQISLSTKIRAASRDSGKLRLNDAQNLGP
jgi:hypothetical protein